MKDASPLYLVYNSLFDISKAELSKHCKQLVEGLQSQLSQSCGMSFLSKNDEFKDFQLTSVLIRKFEQKSQDPS